MIFSLFCRYPEIPNIHCTFLILVDINIHCHIKDIHVCMYIFFFSFQTWQTAVWNLMRMVMAFPDTLSTTIRKDKRTMGLITKSLENGKILLKWMNDKWCGLRKLPSQQQVSSTYPNVKNLRGDPHLKSLHNLIYYSMGLSILGNGWVGDLAFGFYSHTNILSNFWGIIISKSIVSISRILRIMLYNYSYFPFFPVSICGKIIYYFYLL